MSRLSASFPNLAAILARAYLRLVETSRNGAVSCAAGEQILLEVPGPERPDERVVRDVRRAG